MCANCDQTRHTLTIVLNNYGIRRKLLVRSTRNNPDIWYELILALITATLLKKCSKSVKIYDLYAYCTKYVIAALNIHLVSIVL